MTDSTTRPATGEELNPGGIVQLGMGFWGPKTLLSAVELGVFTELAAGPLDAPTLGRRLGLHPRAARDFLDALVALGMLARDGRRLLRGPLQPARASEALPSGDDGSLSMGAARAIAQRFPWERHESLMDIGCAQGCVPVQVALAHPHVTGGGFDLPPIAALPDPGPPV